MKSHMIIFFWDNVITRSYIALTIHLTWVTHVNVKLHIVS